MHYQFSPVNIIQRYFFNEVDRWVLWWPVGIGLGISLYFSLSQEPIFWISLAFLFIIPALIWFWPGGRWVFVPVLSILLGFASAQWRTMKLNTFMLGQPLKQVFIEGVIQEKDYRRGYWRYVIAQVTSHEAEVPSKIRLNDHRKNTFQDLSPDMKVKLLVNLYPLPLPVTPDGFNFLRQAYFQGIGATGRIVEVLSDQPAIHSDFIGGLRHQVNQHLQKNLEPIPAALAMTFITGERGLIPEQIRGQFTDAGLAHLLAISGLHVGLVVGIIFLLVRRILALIPWLVERWHTKKIAASMAMPVGFGYLALSGWGIPAQRAFLMMMIVMVAIILDRQVLSMRLVTVAATLILMIRPESLLSASFQLSFAAVIALIAVYESKGWNLLFLRRQSLWQKILSYMGRIVLTTVAASIATLPLTILLFNKFTLVAVIANVLAIPMMGLIIIPLLLVTVLMMPTGGIRWVTDATNKILGLLVNLAETISQLPGAAIDVATPHLGFLVCTVLGGLWLCLWRQTWRYWGISLWLIAPGFLLYRDPPIVCVTTKTIGIVDHDRGVIKVLGLKPSNFMVDQWQRDWLHYPLEFVQQAYAQEQNLVLSHKKIPSFLCCSSKIVVSTCDIRCSCSTDDQMIIDRAVLKRQGSVFIWPDYRIKGMKEILGNRPWIQN